MVLRLGVGTAATQADIAVMGQLLCVARGLDNKVIGTSEGLANNRQSGSMLL